MRFFWYLLVIFLATSHFVYAEQYEIVKPKIRVENYTIKAGDSLWKIYKKEYKDRATTLKCLQLADYNRIVDEGKIFADTPLRLPKPLVLTQTTVGSNPTTVSLQKAVDNAVKAMSASIRISNITATIPNDLSARIVKGIKESKSSYGLFGQMVIAATFGKTAQGWTRVKVALSGPSYVLDLDETYAIRATVAQECNNVYLQLLKKQIRKLVKPLAPPPPPPIRDNFLREFSNIVYQEITCEKCQLDLATGGAEQDYSDGTVDSSAWLYAAVRCEEWIDAKGNIHKPGLYFNGSKWDGNWQGTFDFEGEIKTYGIEHRIETRDGQEYIFRLGYQERKDNGTSSDIWGRYETESKFKALVFESVIDDFSRMNELWLPRWKAGIGLVVELSSKRNSTWTNSSTGQVVNLDEASDAIGGFQLKAELDVFADRRNLTTISVDFWNNFLFDGDVVSKVTPYFGILGDSLKIGYQFTNSYSDGNHISGEGLAWQINLYDLYAYFKYGQYMLKYKDVKDIKNVFDDPETLLNFDESMIVADNFSTVFDDPETLLRNY